VPFSIALQECLNDIDEKERSLKELAMMATMEGVKCMMEISS
jgi:hypothetical protein